MTTVGEQLVPSEALALLQKCANHLLSEIKRMPLNESAVTGTQALSKEIAAFLDKHARPIP